MQTLKKRQDFLNISRQGVKWVTPAFVLQMRCDPAFQDLNVGYTATKTIGNAIRRNYAKRRLRALAQEVLHAKGKSGCGYVLLARQEILSKKFQDLESDLKWALKKIHALWEEKNENIH